MPSPSAVTTITVQQALECGYDAHVAEGSVTRWSVPDLADLISPDTDEAKIGDSLKSFLLREVAWDSAEDLPPNGTAHWTEALRRLETIREEIERVERAMRHYAPWDA